MLSGCLPAIHLFKSSIVHGSPPPDVDLDHDMPFTDVNKGSVGLLSFHCAQPTSGQWTYPYIAYVWEPDTGIGAANLSNIVLQQCPNNDGQSVTPSSSSSSSSSSSGFKTTARLTGLRLTWNQTGTTLFSAGSLTPLCDMVSSPGSSGGEMSTPVTDAELASLLPQGAVPMRCTQVWWPPEHHDYYP
jgi:hypothetical protein